MPDDKLKGWLFVIIQLALIMAMVFFSIYDAGSVSINQNLGQTAGLIIIILGVLLIVAAIITFNQLMTPSPVPQENYVLKTTGFYKYIRHPVYSFALLTMFGVAFYYRSRSGFLFFIVLIIFILIKISFEEAQLKRKFPDYNSYISKTKKLIPYIY